MSFTNFNIGKNTENFETSEVFDAYGRVDVVMGEDDEGNVITVSYPNVSTVSGRILTVEMPMCTNTTLARTAAQRIYTSLTTKNATAFQYTPMVVDGSLADPSMEFGDSIDVNGVHGGFYTRDVSFGRLMTTDLTAPTDEEINHEYPYEDAQQRQITRTQKDLKSGFYVTNNAIRAEVEARQQAVNGAVTTLRSELNQTATEINAEVSRVDTSKLNHTRTNTSFGWKLTADGFYINKSGSQNVFTATKDGIVIQGNATVTGKIQATSGYIGSSNNGFTITSSAIYNGKTALSNTSDGVYIGRDGIALGANNAFKVTRTGAVTAKNLSLQGGTIDIKDGNGVRAFYVSPTGAVTASNLKINGGSISIGGNFSVSNSGHLTAKSGSFGSLSVSSSGSTYSGGLSGCGGSVSSGLSYSGGSYGSIGSLDTGLHGVKTRVDTIEANYITADWIQSTYGSALSGSFADLTVANNTWSYVNLTVVTGVNFESQTVNTTTRRFWITEGY